MAVPVFGVGALRSAFRGGRMKKKARRRQSHPGQRPLPPLPSHPPSTASTAYPASAASSYSCADLPTGSPLACSPHTSKSEPGAAAAKDGPRARRHSFLFGTAARYVGRGADSPTTALSDPTPLSPGGRDDRGAGCDVGVYQDRRLLDVRGSSSVSDGGGRRPRRAASRLRRPHSEVVGSAAGRPKRPQSEIVGSAAGIAGRRPKRPQSEIVRIGAAAGRRNSSGLEHVQLAADLSRLKREIRELQRARSNELFREAQRSKAALRRSAPPLSSGTVPDAGSPLLPPCRSGAGAEPAYAIARLRLELEETKAVARQWAQAAARAEAELRSASAAAAAAARGERADAEAGSAQPRRPVTSDSERPPNPAAADDFLLLPSDEERNLAAFGSGLPPVRVDPGLAGEMFADSLAALAKERDQRLAAESAQVAAQVALAAAQSELRELKKRLSQLELDGGPCSGESAAAQPPGRASPPLRGAAHTSGEGVQPSCREKVVAKRWSKFWRHLRVS